MTNVAPGIYTNVLDFSAYAQRLASTIPCFVGAARKGSMTEAIEITSEEDCITKLGKPLTDDYGVQSAIQFLRQGSRLLYRRVGREDANIYENYYPYTADVFVPGTSHGSDATAATGTVTFTGSVNPVDGERITLRTIVPMLDFQNDNNGAIGNVAITVSGPGAANLLVSGMSGGTPTTPATGTLKLKNSYIPVIGDIVTISDGTTSKVFEFGGGTGGNINVTIVAGNPYSTIENLLTAVNAAVFNVTAYSGYADQTYIFEFDSNSVVTPTYYGVTIGATAAATLLNLMAAISSYMGTVVTVHDTTTTAPQVTITTKGKGLDRNALIIETGTNIAAAGLSGAVDAVPGSGTSIVKMLAASPGTWGNNLQVKFETTAVAGAPADNFDLIVYDIIDDAGTIGAVERFRNLSPYDHIDENGDYDADGTVNPRFIETVLSEGILGEYVASAYVRADMISTAGHPTKDVAYLLGLGTGGSTIGTDGIDDLTKDDYIGTSTNRRGLSALTNPETTEFNLLLIPGISDTDVITKAFDVLAMRGRDAMYFVDTPFGLTMTDAIDWHNGLLSYTGAPTSPLDNYLGSCYWSWCQVYDNYNKQNIWLPPSGFVAAQASYTDTTAATWFTIAGKTRGRLTNVLQVEFSPDIYERETLAGGTNRLNPIVDFKDAGPTIYGNRSLQRRATSLDSVHTVRGLINAKKLIATAVQYLVFEPNDPVTWLKFVDLVNPTLSAMKAGRGLEAYKVVCDASTNPPEQRQRKVMKGKIQMVPIDDAEVIEIDFAISAAGTSFGV